VARMDGKVVVITGGARGQRAAHALRMAAEGADVAICDLCEQIDSVPYPMSTEADLESVVAQVEATGRRCVAIKADVRERDDMDRLVATAVAELGKVDVVLSNAGIAPPSNWETRDDAVFDDVLDVNLRGAWNLCRATIPHLIERGEGGSIVLTSSVSGLQAVYGMLHYDISKYGVQGLMKNLSAELAPHRIRVNSVAPGFVKTPMTVNETFINLVAGKEEGGTVEELAASSETLGLLPYPWVEAEDVASAALWLASDESRYVTGITIPIDLGQTTQPAGIPPAGMAKILAAEQPA
jgi:(+)-trans-carveol dehydrogenase